MLNPANASWTSAFLLLALVLPCWAQAVDCPEEKRRVAAVRERIEREWPLRTTDTVVQYIRDFGHSLAVRADIGHAASWRFEVLRDYSVNAFSIGDGLIYLTEGAILNAADESELAAILAHEMGHQLAGHFCAGPTPNENRKSWWETLLSPTDSATSEIPTRQDAKFGSLRRGVDPAKEREAEDLAANILRTAGYDPMAQMTPAQRKERSRETEAAPGLLAPSFGSNLSLHPNGIHQPSAWQANHELRRIQALLRQER